MPRDMMAGTDAAQQQAAAADDAFGADLYRLLAAGRRNVVFSPASIAAALQMALCGAGGATAAQIAAALHLAGPDAATDGLRLLSGVLSQAGDGTNVTLRAPNTMWVQAGLPLEPGFTSRLRDAAALTVRPVDFRGAPRQARAQINELIAEQTAGKITDLLGPDAVSAATLLVLANAVYLKARWAFPFPASATADTPFYPGPDGNADAEPAGSPLTVPMMRRTADLAYLRADGYQAVLLPYQDGRLAMAIVLPDGPLPTLAPRLAGGLGPLLAGAARQRVALSLPKFRQRAGFGLIPVLRQLGVEDDVHRRGGLQRDYGAGTPVHQRRRAPGLH